MGLTRGADEEKVKVVRLAGVVCAVAVSIRLSCQSMAKHCTVVIIRELLQCGAWISS